MSYWILQLNRNAFRVSQDYCVGPPAGEEDWWCLGKRAGEIDVEDAIFA